jgi:hypothetical protein
MTWINELTITESDIQNKEGFVYEIEDTVTGKIYIGIKKFKKAIVRKPLKGNKNKRHSFKESDWRTYNSSNQEWAKLIEKKPERFKKTIVRVCDDLTDLKAWEAYFQLDYYIHGRWQKLQNEMINLRIRIRK